MNADREEELTPREQALFDAGKQKAENTLTGRVLLYATAGGALVGALLTRLLVSWGIA